MLFLIITPFSDSHIFLLLLSRAMWGGTRFWSFSLVILSCLYHIIGTCKSGFTIYLCTMTYSISQSCSTIQEQIHDIHVYCILGNLISVLYIFDILSVCWCDNSYIYFSSSLIDFTLFKLLHIFLRLSLLSVVRFIHVLYHSERVCRTSIICFLDNDIIFQCLIFSA